MPDPISLETLTFDNRFVRELPADSNPVNSRRQVREACYSRVHPTEMARPQLVAYSREVAELIGLDPAACETPLFENVFAGNRQLNDMDPFAMCYGGHQFGNWAGQLGDGRAINLGTEHDGREPPTIPIRKSTRDRSLESVPAREFGCPGD